jgi:hypothetical protein
MIMTPFCPRCRSEYRPGFKTCSDCQAELVDELAGAGPGPGEPDSRMVAVFEAPDQISALAVSALLNDHQIDSVVRSDQIPMYDGVAMMLFPRWGRVLVLEDREAQARELVGQFLAGTVLPGESDQTDEDGQ